MRIVIKRGDNDKLVYALWNALYPLVKSSKGDIMVFMTYDYGDRAMVINFKGLKTEEVLGIKILEEFNPSKRKHEEE